MLKSPSKFLSRKFLYELLDNECISPAGVEYDRGEVLDLLMEKETRLRAPEFDRMLREKARKEIAEIDPWAKIRDTQDLIFLLVKALRAKNSL